MSEHKVQPPGWPLKALRFFLKKEYIEEIEGDMEQTFYATASEHSLAKAKRDYTLEMLSLLRPALIRNFKQTYLFTSISMYKNYMKVAWRNLLKKKVYSAINIFGLGLGIASCLLIFMYVEYERSFDNYHSKGERIYRVIHGAKKEDHSKYWVWGNAPIGQALADNFPEIDKVVQLSGRSDLLLANGENMYQEEGVFFADSTVFDVFDWKLLKGDPKKALVAPFTIVLTESTARKYFGNDDPVGKFLKGSNSAGRANEGEYLVTGVIADVPANSHFRFNALLSMSTFRKSNKEIFDMWGYVDFYTYFLVNDKFDPAKFEAKIPGFIGRYIKDPRDNYTIAIEPLKDIYLKSTAQRQPGETGSLANLYIFSVIGVFILAIAIINFMNLSTARSMERGKEVGLRKSIGADRKSLMSQFLGESLMIVYMAVVIAVMIVIIALPGMIDITGRALDITPYITPVNIALLIIASFFIGIIAGSYPSFVLSSFSPVKVLKGINKTGKGGVTLRRALVIFQFSLSIALVAGTMIVYFQMSQILNKDLGFDKERMLILDFNYDEKVNQKREVFKTELEARPDILSVAFSRSVPGSYFPNAGTGIESPDGQTQMEMGQPVFQVGIDFVNHYGLKLVAGRSYSRDHPSDTIGGLVINESAARQYGYKNPADIIGKKYKQWGREGEIIGVVKDFNFTSLHRNIEPLTMPLEPFASRYLSIKIKSNNLPATIEEVHKIWRRLAPQRPFLYSFLDDDFARQYQKDFSFRKLFTTFSCLAILIASLGLLGLATYTAELRTKEIGIRKVLGANVASIITLISKDFILLIGISMLIATPIAWYAMRRWLEDFAYHIDIEVWIFVLAGAFALAIAVLTISYQAIKAALLNPVASLKSE